MTTPTPAITLASDAPLSVVGYRRRVPILNGHCYEVVWHWSTKTGDGWEPIYGALAEGEEPADYESWKAARNAQPLASDEPNLTDGGRPMTLRECVDAEYGCVQFASDATPQEELKTLCDWVIERVNDTAYECSGSIWMHAIELREAAKKLKEILE